MGEIKVLGSLKELPKREVTAQTIWTDLCENVHLHYRNIRLDFSEVEWAHFRAAINMLGLAVEECAIKNNFREGNPNFLIQQVYQVPLSASSEYYPDRVSIEKNLDNTVHLHYRDVRLHLSSGEFELMAQAFEEARRKFRKPASFPFLNTREAKRGMVPIDSVNPYDKGHKPGVIDDDHRAGIEYCKGLIMDGHKIRPIMVMSNGQRIDGFKRYMAFKELGYKEIEVIVDPFPGRLGIQERQSMIDD